MDRRDIQQLFAASQFAGSDPAPVRMPPVSLTFSICRTSEARAGPTISAKRHGVIEQMNSVLNAQLASLAALRQRGIISGWCFLAATGHPSTIADSAGRRPASGRGIPALLFHDFRRSAVRIARTQRRAEVNGDGDGGERNREHLSALYDSGRSDAAGAVRRLRRRAEGQSESGATGATAALQAGASRLIPGEL